MVKEVKIQPTTENISELELKPLADVPDDDKEKQEDYDKRMKLFMKAFDKLQEKHQIKLLQIPARIIYFDKKYEENK